MIDQGGLAFGLLVIVGLILWYDKRQRKKGPPDIWDDVGL